MSDFWKPPPGCVLRLVFVMWTVFLGPISSVAPAWAQSRVTPPSLPAKFPSEEPAPEEPNSSQGVSGAAETAGAQGESETAKEAAPPASSADDKRRCVEAHARGQQLKNSDALIAALAEFHQCLQPACPAVVQQDCLNFSHLTRQALPSVIVRVFEAGQRLSNFTVHVDGIPRDVSIRGRAIELDPGAHELSVETEDGVTRVVQLMLLKGEKFRSVEVRLPPRDTSTLPTLGPPPEPSVNNDAAVELPEVKRAMPTVSYVLLAGGAVGLASFMYFGLSSNQVKNDCAPRCSPSQVRVIERDAWVADVSLGVSVLAIGGAVAAYLLAPEESVESKKVAWVLRAQKRGFDGAVSIGF